MNIRLLAFMAAAAAMLSGFAQDFYENEDHGDGTAANKPQGFNFFNKRLNIKPSLALSYTYDSNIDTQREARDDSIIAINPQAAFTWFGERWELVGSLWYSYNAYCDYSDELGSNNYGERLAYKWSNVDEDGKGWNLSIAERYQFVSSADSLNSGQGRGIWRDRQSIDATGILERRFNERWHANLSGQYYYLDYDNDTGNYGPLYGWSQYSVGLEAGYVASRWTDVLIAGGYSSYKHNGGQGERHYDNNSKVWSLQGGLGTHSTEQIKYRALMGVSQIEYAGMGNTDCGWTYQLAADWKITERVKFSMLGNSYYQPSERSLGHAVKVYAISGGLSYLTLGDKMTITADVAWRHEQDIYSDRELAYGDDSDEDILSARLGASYTFNRWVSIYAHLLWEECWRDESASWNEYDRFRGTLGLRLHY